MATSFHTGAAALLLMFSSAAAGEPACFGALAAGCATTAATGGAAYCRAAGGELECVVHAGSIEHDACCLHSPQGRGCGHAPENPAQCAYEWQKAQHRTAQGLYWLRRMNPRGSGVDFNAFCAPPGTVLAAGDERWCCSRAASALAERDPQGVNKLRCQ